MAMNGVIRGFVLALAVAGAIAAGCGQFHAMAPVDHFAAHCGILAGAWFFFSLLVNRASLLAVVVHPERGEPWRPVVEIVAAVLMSISGIRFLVILFDTGNVTPVQLVVLRFVDIFLTVAALAGGSQAWSWFLAWAKRRLS
jgi:hypothetical protein